MHHFGFALGYAAHIFCTTDAKYVMFCIGWRKSLKDSMTPGNKHLKVPEC